MKKKKIVLLILLSETHRVTWRQPMNKIRKYSKHNNVIIESITSKKTSL
jgi:hypothetical protein